MVTLNESGDAWALRCRWTKRGAPGGHFLAGRYWGRWPAEHGPIGSTGKAVSVALFATRKEAREVASRTRSEYVSVTPVKVRCSIVELLP